VPDRFDGPLSTTRRGALLGLASIASGIGNQVAWAATPAGSVYLARGECLAQAAREARALAVASPIFLGEWLRTGRESRLGVKLGETTDLRLGEEARIRVDRFLARTGGLLVLERGGVLLGHEKNSDDADFSVRSPFALVAVRGTRFFAGPSNGVFGVFAEQGIVDVTAARRTVRLTAGMGTDIARRGAAPTPPKMWSANRVANAIASVS